MRSKNSMGHVVLLYGLRELPPRSLQTIHIKLFWVGIWVFSGPKINVQENKKIFPKLLSGLSFLILCLVGPFLRFYLYSLGKNFLRGGFLFITKGRTGSVISLLKFPSFLPSVIEFHTKIPNQLIILPPCFKGAISLGPSPRLNQLQVEKRKTHKFNLSFFFAYFRLWLNFRNEVIIFSDLSGIFKFTCFNKTQPHGASKWPLRHWWHLPSRLLGNKKLFHGKQQKLGLIFFFSMQTPKYFQGERAKVP